MCIYAWSLDFGIIGYNSCLLDEDPGKIISAGIQEESSQASKCI